VIPNGVDLDIRPARDTIECMYLFAVGRLVAVKGFDLALQAFARAELPVDVRFVIAGDGPDRESLEKRAAELGVIDRVTFLGWLDEQSIADAMGAALAVVVPSRVEAFGIVALEAWRAGSPLLMTRHGGATEFMTDEVNALLIDPTDAEAFALAIRRVVADHALRDSLTAGGTEIVQAFTWARVVDDYGRVYDDLPIPPASEPR
jgi:glycogen(starch) synthase